MSESSGLRNRLLPLFGTLGLTCGYGLGSCYADSTYPSRSERSELFEYRKRDKDTIDLSKSDRKAIYQLLNAERKEIRLLRLFTDRSHQKTHIRLELIRGYLNDLNLEYDALSYVWGAPVYSNKIKVNGRPMGVTENLFYALSLLSKRRLLQRAIWIDAICINQQNVQERNQQVSLMKHIY